MRQLERIEIHTPALRALLKRRHISIKELASADIVHCSDRTIRKYLQEGALPLDLLGRIMFYLIHDKGVTVNELQQ